MLSFEQLFLICLCCLLNFPSYKHDVGVAGADNSSNPQLPGGVLLKSHSRDSSGNNSDTDEMGYLEPRPTRNAERVGRSSTNRAVAAAVKGGASGDSSSPIDANKKGGTMLNPFLR